MANKKPRILIFTEHFGKRILAQDIVGINNLEKSLNNIHSKYKNRIYLEGVSSCYRNEKGIYVPKDHKRNHQSINTNQIDLIYGPENLIYSENSLPSYTEVSVLWGIRGLHHDLIGDINVHGTYASDFKKNNLKGNQMKNEFELFSYVSNQLKRNFVSLKNLRTDSDNAKKEFESLFKGIKMPKIKRILVNNKKQSNSHTGHAIYVGKDSKK